MTKYNLLYVFIEKCHDDYFTRKTVTQRVTTSLVSQIYLGSCLCALDVMKALKNFIFTERSNIFLKKFMRKKLSLKNSLIQKIGEIVLIHAKIIERIIFSVIIPFNFCQIHSILRDQKLVFVIIL